MLDGLCKKCPDYMMAAFVFENGSDKQVWKCIPDA
jgi:hypothetical protein